MTSVNILNPVAHDNHLCRLDEKTHALARRGLTGEFGREMVYAEVRLEDHVPTDGLSDEMRYAMAVRLIAETAPLRVLPHELIIGSATYREAPYHKVPIYGGSSTSHLTLGFERVLTSGYSGLRAQIEERLSRKDLDDRGIDLLNSMLVCLDAAKIWHGRHVDLVRARARESSDEQQRHYERLLENIARVPENPPETFYEAVQALWFMYAFQRLCGNWPGIGRIDQMLGGYLRRDLEQKRMTLDEAREILAHFWIKGTEWIDARTYDDIGASGDAQHYQNIVLSGVDAEGHEVTNEVTYLVLDIVEELHISDFPVAVRLNGESPDRLLRRIAEVQRLGGGIVSIYSEEVVIKGLVKLGIPLEEARCFANDGCWEVLIPGKTAFGYRPFDLVEILQQSLGMHDATAPAPEYADFDHLYQCFLDRLSETLNRIHQDIDQAYSDGGPTTLISLFIEDCIEKGRGYYDRGARYNFLAPHAGGMADVAGSLLVIKEMVFEENRLSLRRLIDALRADWAGYESLQTQIRRRFEFYGNDSDKADDMMGRIFKDYTDLVWEVPQRNGVFRPAGISTFGREIPWREHRKATAHGFRADDILATNFSPTPGTDRHGPTAVIQSYCKMDFERLPNGGTLELKIHPSCFQGENGLASLVALLRSFVTLGGFYLNIDVVDSAVLLDAQQHPDKYPNLAVRVAGWCARFNTLNKTWQDMIIQRTQQMM